MKDENFSNELQPFIEGICEITRKLYLPRLLSYLVQLLSYSIMPKQYFIDRICPMDAGNFINWF